MLLGSTLAIHQGFALQRLNDRCFGGGGNPTGIACCEAGTGAIETGPSSIACVPNGNNLPGTPPTHPNPQPDPGGGGGGGSGSGPTTPPNNNEPPECQPGQRPVPPSGKIVGVSNIRAGESMSVEELLKQPGAKFVLYTPDEIEKIEQDIDAYVAQANASKPKCKETCRSCTKNKESRQEKRANAYPRCLSNYERLAEQQCEQGQWRNDPRRGDSCGILESLHSEWCEQNPGEPVRQDECGVAVTNPRTHEVEQHCEETAWWGLCKRSWTGDIPDTDITNNPTNLSVSIEGVTISTGTDTVTVHVPGGKGYASACNDANKELFDKINKEEADCWGRVEAANPGVTCP
jgi:hypothetical protein